MDRESFTAALGWIFENSPWVAERAWERRPFNDLAELHAAMVSVVDAAPAAEQLNLLKAHPDLGTRARISAASTGEQAEAGLDRLTADEFEGLTRLNAAYKAKFGFPFLFAVKGSTKYDILAALATRSGSTPEAEHAEALRQVARIALWRLRDLLP